MSNAKLLAISVLCLILGWILIQASPALVPVVIAIVTAYLLNPLVDTLEKKLKGRRKLAIGLVLIAFLLLMALFINLVLPPVINQASQFVNEYDTISANLGNAISGALEFLKSSGIPESVLAEVQNVLAELLSWLGSQIAAGISKALGFIFGIVDMVLVVIMAVYFLSSGKSMVKNLYDSSPEWLKPTLRNLRTETHTIIWSYAKTQLIIAVVVGIVSTIAFMIIGVRFSGLLGLLNGILNFIPLFGSLIAGAFATIVSLVTGGLTQAIITLGAVLVIQQTEGNFITPKLQGKSTGLHPVFIMIIILVANQMWGVAGMFVAVPLFGLARLFFKEAASLIGKMK
jgi:predicted PurR-regulated permease PerM